MLTCKKHFENLRCFTSQRRPFTTLASSWVTYRNAKNVLPQMVDIFVSLITVMQICVKQGIFFLT